MTGHAAHEPERRIWPTQGRAGAGQWSRATIGLRRIVRRIVGSGSIVTPDGVRYHPVGHHSLTRSLSRRGPGFKDYDVTFPGGNTMRLRVEPGRVIADLTGSRFAFEHEMLVGRVRPGSRALVINAGTGDTAHWLAQEVGPSGAVVALETDEHSVEFARLRYPGDNIAHEHGDGSLLAPEPAEAFEFVLAPRPFDPAHDDIDLSPLGRLVAPGGSLAVSTASGSALASALAHRLAQSMHPGSSVITLERAGITLALGSRPN